MKGKIGYPARIVTPVPHMRELARGETKELSDTAKFRLRVFDNYCHQSAQFSVSGLLDVGVTCRHFGIHRSYFSRWKGRYDKQRRTPEYSRELIRVVRAIQEHDPMYSARKIHPILMRTRGTASVPGVSMPGRLIRRENLFFQADVKRHKKHSKAAVKPMNARENLMIWQHPLPDRLLSLT